jgi:tripartite-type tricarboxylate transporter receptor subunit TctC
MTVFKAALAATLATVAAVAVQVTSALAAYPDRPITLVVPFAAGGPTDVVARIMGDHMSRTLGQQVVIENVTGAGGTTGATRVKRAAPDGYTILMGNLGSMSASVAMYGEKLQYDPRTDFEFVLNTGGVPMYLSPKKDLPAKDFKEFVAYVKANAAKLNFGSGGVGATSHLTCLFLHSLLGVDVTHVPFKGSGPAMQAVLAGQVDYVCDQSTTVVPQIQGGALRGFVIADEKRSALTPDVPTSAEVGLPKFIVSGWNALFAPKGTPADIVTKINAAAVAALKDAAVKKKLNDIGVVIPDDAGLTPAALGAHVKSEVDKWSPVIKAAGVTGN